MSASEGLNSNEKDAAFLHKDLKGESQKTTTGIHHLSDWSDSHDLYHGKINGQHHATSVKRFKGNTGPNSLHKTGFQGRSHHDIIKSAVKRDNPHLSSAEAHNVATQIHNSHPTVKEDLNVDPQSMDNRRLSSIARNPNHPLHTHAKAELVRRKVKKAEMDEGAMKRIATTQASKTDRMASTDKKGLETFKKKPTTEADAFGRLGITSPTMKHIDKKLDKVTKRTQTVMNKRPRSTMEEKDPEEYDKEGEMMKSQLRQICSANEKLMQMVGDDDNLPEWVQSKVTKATDYIRSVRDYLESEKMDDEEEMDESVDWVCGKCNCDPCTCGEEIEEKTLTPAEKRKREKIAKAIERDNPDMPMDKKMAIATATAKRVAESKDDDYHKTLGQTKNSDEGIAALKKKHGMSHTKAVATLKRLMGEQKVNEVLDTPQARKSYRDKRDASYDRAAKSMSAKILGDKPQPHSDELRTMKNREKGLKMLNKKTGAKPSRWAIEDTDLTELKKSTLASYIKKASDDRAKNAYDIGKSGKINYKGLKRRQGINRAVNKMANEENIDEVLDTPKAMQSYKDKAKYSKDRAANSAAAKILRGPDADGNRADHSAELKTMAKRRSGEKMVDRLAGRKTFKALRAKK